MKKLGRSTTTAIGDKTNNEPHLAKWNNDDEDCLRFRSFA